MVNKVVTPRFSEDELRALDRCVNAGVGRCRSDLVRIATIQYLEHIEDKRLGTNGGSQ